MEERRKNDRVEGGEGVSSRAPEHGHVRLNTRTVVHMCVSVRTRAHECASLYVHMHLNTRALVFRCVCAGGFKEEGAHEGRRLCGCGGEELLLLPPDRHGVKSLARLQTHAVHAAEYWGAEF